jgi:GcrA cell cycle regulator
VSRNSVLAKIRRLGITAARAHPRRRRRSIRMGKRAASSHAVPDHLRASKPAERSWPFPAWIIDARLHAESGPYVDQPGIDADIARAQRRTLLDLDSHTCRWPVGDPGSCDFFFCGAPPRSGRPYCAEHCARAYVPSAAVSAHAPGSADASSAPARVRDEPCGQDARAPGITQGRGR